LIVIIRKLAYKIFFLLIYYLEELSIKSHRGKGAGRSPPLTFIISSCPMAENPTFSFVDENIIFSFLIA